MNGRPEYTPPEAGEDIAAWMTAVYSQQLQWELELVRNHSWGFSSCHSGGFAESKFKKNWKH